MINFLCYLIYKCDERGSALPSGFTFCARLYDFPASGLEKNYFLNLFYMTGILNSEVVANCESGKILHKQAFTDDQLFNLCKRYGENVRNWRQKFAGLLPEVFKRRLYEKKGFSSIFEFAAKLAGMSQEQVRLVLNLERKFENTPSLHSLLTNGEVSANKLVRIASIATPQNQEELARITEILSNRAIETFVKDEKRALQMEKSNNESRNLFELIVTRDGNGNVFPSCPGNQNGLQEPPFEEKSLHVQILAQSGQPALAAVSKASLSTVASLPASTPLSSPSVASPLEIIKLKLDKEVLQELLALQEKNIDVNRLIRKMLSNREAEIARAKAETGAEQAVTGANQYAVAAVQSTTTTNQHTTVVAQRTADANSSLSAKDHPLAKKASRPTRYIPAKIRKIINEEQGDKCAMRGCAKPAEVTHHELPFAMTKNHDPHYLKKLCRAHHELQHIINVKFYEHTRGRLMYKAK
jgi:hypothetical protein